MDVKPAHLWSDDERLEVAALIVDPQTNGGMESGATAEQVAAALPVDGPAWGVWLDGWLVFLVGLMPFDGERGCLHVSGQNVLSPALHRELVAGFLDSLEGVSVFTLTTSPALARLARSVGFVQTGDVDGVLLLERAR